MCHSCFIIPPAMLRRLLAETTDAATRNVLVHALETSSFLRGQRVATQGLVAPKRRTGAPTHRRTKTRRAAAAPPKHRTVYDAGHRRSLPGTEIRDEGDKPVVDPAVNSAYDNAGITYDFYKKVLKRDSIDDKGLTIVSSVHYGVNYDNAMWNGDQMVYGDGDRKLFMGFVDALDVVGHELTHGVTQYTVRGGLVYEGLSGALNESISDVFGSVIKQWSLKQSVTEADWLIGAGILGPGLGKALRSMAKPGTAWTHDDQPDNMSKVDPDADVHTNSGVPNRAFYLAAMALGGNSWDQAAHIWYDALPNLSARADFREMREATAAAARDRYTAKVAGAVEQAWDTVGVS